MNPPAPTPFPDSGRKIEVQQALARLRRESRWYALRAGGSVCCGLTAFICFILAVMPGLPSGTNLALLSCCLLSIIICAAMMPRFDRKSLAVLAEAPDARMIGPLLDAMVVAPEAKVQAIQELLTSLLPLLRAPDAVLLNHRQRRLLYDALLLGDADRELNYLLAVLQAITQIGEEEALRCLRQTVQLGAITEGQIRLLEEAARCLRAAEALLAQQNIRNSLLRASAPVEPPTELLRAAQATPETSPQTLLRPTE